MVTEFTCSFCGAKFSKAKGITFVKNDGTILRFCSSKCRKNMLDLKRNPAKIKWTAFYRGSSK